MNNLHSEIQQWLQNAPHKEFGYFDLAKYLGTPNHVWSIATPLVNSYVSQFKKAHPDLSYKELVDLLNSLYEAPTFNEKAIAPSILARYPKLKKQLDITLYNSWLNHLSGWAEIDCTCQSAFTAEEMLENWPAWKKQLTAFAKSTNISKRRASLVLLCKPVRTGDDARLVTMAFANIDRLKGEKDILITKAVSWLLRSLIKHHAAAVTEYLDAHESELPRIAVRETRRKLLTGKK